MDLTMAAWMQVVALFAGTLVGYILLFKSNTETSKKRGPYSETYWNFFIKKWLASIKLRKKRNSTFNSTDSFLATGPEEELEKPQQLLDDKSVDSLSVLGVDQKGNRIHIKLTRKRHRVIEVWLMVTLDNGKSYQLPNHPNTVVLDIVSQTWCGGGLKLQLCEPLRKWRITFNGLLRCGIRNDWKCDENGDDLEHVRFGFIWSACSGPVDIQADWSSSLQSQALAREHWRNGDWLNLVDHLGNGYEQWGMLYGTWTDADSVTKVLHLRGLRKRWWGLDEVEWQHRRVAVVGVAPDGLMFSIVATCCPQGLTHAVFGHVREPNGQQAAIDWSDISLPECGEYRDQTPLHMVIRFGAKNQHYTAVVDFQQQYEMTLYGGQPWDHEVRVKPFQCGLNTQQATGIAEFWYRYSGDCPIEVPQAICRLQEPVFEVDSSVVALHAPLVVPFGDTMCQSSAIVGGKGASLALMTSFNNNQLNVPPGFCLTVSALELQLKQSPQLKEAVTSLKQISCGLIKGDLKEHCDKTVSVFESTPVCIPVAREVVKYLRSLNVNLLLAVRSSAIGEDSEDMSAAGQNATILGQRQADIVKAISKCWASLYTFQSVQYRRQHGQEVDCGMGVVVQEMVAAKSAGVLFSRHPITGDPRQVLITANYGLGESVVSALVEPDTIVLARDWKDKLSVKETHCGSKGQQINIASMGGVTTTSVESETSSQLCITEAEALALARLGVQVEALFGGPRDIEWAITNDKINLLQARPITSLDSWSDFELLHELDSPIMTDVEVLTIANTGEVLPGAVSPLTSSWIVRALDLSVRDGWIGNTGHCYHMSTVVLSHHHTMLNVLNTMLRGVEERITIGNRVSDLAVFGHSVTTPELHQVAIERNGILSGMKRTQFLFQMIQDSVANRNITKQAKKLSEDFTLSFQDFASASSLYTEISSAFYHLLEMSRYHGHTSRVSFFSQAIAMTVLAEGKEELTADHISDISLLLSSCSDVISAEIPTALKELSDTIINLGLGSEFSSLPSGLALKWLDLHASDIAASFRLLLSRHEHRGIREFELMTETWGMKPEAVIETLQSMVGAADSRPKVKQSQSNQLPKLQSPKKAGTKVALHWLMSWCRGSVARREGSKACLIKMVHQFRLAYRRLGQLMVNSSKLPDADLVFFFTHYELGLILRSSDPNLVTKALRRKRLWPQWDQLSFPEISRGLPQPITVGASLASNNSSTLRLQGTSVCPGTVMGRACVINKLEEISQLKANDILITHSTDIGWSPYFPMLGGVVTELGGLISHGAVVAREYGLPCIVGAVSATSIFKTGDTVLLVGSTGVLEKIVQQKSL